MMHEEKQQALKPCGLNRQRCCTNILWFTQKGKDNLNKVKVNGKEMALKSHKEQKFNSGSTINGKLVKGQTVTDHFNPSNWVGTNGTSEKLFCTLSLSVKVR